jgi:hypothetical protein
MTTSPDMPKPIPISPVGHVDMMFRWMVAITFGLIGWGIILANFGVVYAWLVRHKHHSWIPLFGGFFALAGMALCPLPEVRRFAFLPLFIDTGYCISALTIGLLMEVYARKKKQDG